MKVDVLASNLKQEDHASLFKPIKVWIYFGWILGIFPVNFDKNLLQFRLKFFSFTTIFALIRLLLVMGIIFALILLIPWTGKWDSLAEFYSEVKSKNESLCFLPWSESIEVQEVAVLKKQNDYILVRYKRFTEVWMLLIGNTFNSPN